MILFLNKFNIFFTFAHFLIKTIEYPINAVSTKTKKKLENF